jgi:hypothetical protein
MYACSQPQSASLQYLPRHSLVQLSLATSYRPQASLQLYLLSIVYIRAISGSMDSVAFQKVLDLLHVTEKTRVEYYDNRNGQADGHLDDNGLEAKMPDLVR